MKRIGLLIPVASSIAVCQQTEAAVQPVSSSKSNTSRASAVKPAVTPETLLQTDAIHLVATLSTADGKDGYKGIRNGGAQ